MSDMNLCSINCCWHILALVGKKEVQEAPKGGILVLCKYSFPVFQILEGGQYYPIFLERRACRGLPDLPHNQSSSSADREVVNQASQLLSTCLYPQL